MSPDLGSQTTLPGPCDLSSGAGQPLEVKAYGTTFKTVKTSLMAFNAIAMIARICPTRAEPSTSARPMFPRISPATYPTGSRIRPGPPRAEG